MADAREQGLGLGLGPDDPDEADQRMADAREQGLGLRLGLGPDDDDDDEKRPKNWPNRTTVDSRLDGLSPVQAKARGGVQPPPPMDTEAKTAPRLTCLQRHPLALVTRDFLPLHASCNVCHNDVASTGTWSCQLCDYDLCDACARVTNRTKGTTGAGLGRYYCGRQLGVEAIPGSDGRCGPYDGPQCQGCQAYLPDATIDTDESTPTATATTVDVDVAYQGRARENLAGRLADDDDDDHTKNKKRRDEFGVLSAGNYNPVSVQMVVQVLPYGPSSSSRRAV